MPRTSTSLLGAASAALALLAALPVAAAPADDRRRAWDAGPGGWHHDRLREGRTRAFRDQSLHHHHQHHRPRIVVIAPRPDYRYRAHFWSPSFYRFDERYGRFDYRRHYRAGHGYFGPVGTPGWRLLYPWLADAPAARHWAMWRFDRDRDGLLSRSEAALANRSFDRLADFDRDGRLSRWEIDEALQEMTDEYRYAYRVR